MVRLSICRVSYRDAVKPRSFLTLKAHDTEAFIKEDLLRFFAAKKIAYVDVRGAIGNQICKHVEIYPATFDSHLQTIGYGVIARVIYETLHVPPIGK